MMRYGSGECVTIVCTLVSPGSWLGTGTAIVIAVASMAQRMMDRIRVISSMGKIRTLALLHTRVFSWMD